MALTAVVPEPRARFLTYRAFGQPSATVLRTAPRLRTTGPQLGAGTAAASAGISLSTALCGSRARETTHSHRSERSPVAETTTTSIGAGLRSRGRKVNV